MVALSETLSCLTRNSPRSSKNEVDDDSDDSDDLKLYVRGNFEVESLRKVLRLVEAHEENGGDGRSSPDGHYHISIERLSVGRALGEDDGGDDGGGARVKVDVRLLVTCVRGVEVLDKLVRNKPVL